MGYTLQNKVIQFHEKIVFDFLKKFRNYLVANPIFYFLRISKEWKTRMTITKNVDKNNVLCTYELNECYFF